MKVPHITQLGDPAVYERFRREVAIGKLLNHSDVPVAVAISEDNPALPRFEIRRGRVAGEGAGRKKGRLSGRGSDGKMVANLLDALHYCHEEVFMVGIIKPENLVSGPRRPFENPRFRHSSHGGFATCNLAGFFRPHGHPRIHGPRTDQGGAGVRQKRYLRGRMPHLSPAERFSPLLRATTL